MGEEGKSPRSGSRRSSRRPRLNAMNLLNIGYCFLSTLFNVGIGLCGMFGLPTYAVQSARFPTIISPSPYFITAIYPVIFATQGIFTIFQVTPVLRARPQVQDGVKYYYGLASFMQVLYTLTYNTEMLVAAVPFAFGVVASLRSLVKSQNEAQADNSWAEYWLLRFPFQLHLGWMYFVSLLTLQNAFVFVNFSNPVQNDRGRRQHRHHDHPVAVSPVLGQQASRHRSTRPFVRGGWYRFGVFHAILWTRPRSAPPPHSSHLYVGFHWGRRSSFRPQRLGWVPKMLQA